MFPNVSINGRIRSSGQFPYTICDPTVPDYSSPPRIRGAAYDYEFRVATEMDGRPALIAPAAAMELALDNRSELREAEAAVEEAEREVDRVDGPGPRGGDDTGVAGASSGAEVGPRRGVC